MAEKINVWTNEPNGHWISPRGYVIYGDLRYQEDNFSKSIMDRMVAGEIRAIAFPTNTLEDETFQGEVKIRGNYIIFEAIDGGSWKTTYMCRPRNPRAFKRAMKIDREAVLANYVF